MICPHTRRDYTLVEQYGNPTCSECRVIVRDAADHQAQPIVLRPATPALPGRVDDDPVYRQALRDSGHGAFLR